MTCNLLRALVVDDERDIQRLIVSALRLRGFHCDVANDGREAQSQLTSGEYDVVITDLRMPNMHGHALVQTILDHPTRPVVVVHTGVLEPKLARDLLQRGVDDILFKPVNFAFLALKLLTLVERSRANRKFAATEGKSAEPSDLREQYDSERTAFQRFSDKLANVGKVLPLSNAALKVYEMTKEGNWNDGAIAAAIQRDAALTADVLRLANCPLYAPTSQRVVRMEDAVQRIGQKKLGNISLATSALTAMTQCSLPWLDANLTWKRSMAAGVVLELLAEEGGVEDESDGLFLSAILHSLGRVLLGAAFPELYAKMIAACKETGTALCEHERCLLPFNDAEALVHVLETWSISEEIVLPLRLAGHDFTSITRLPEPTRKKAELIKAAIALGNIVVGRWHDWDLIDIPPQSVLTRLGVSDLSSMLHQARVNLSKVANYHPSELTHSDTVQVAISKVPYCTLDNGRGDVVRELLPTLGFQPEACAEGELLDSHRAVLVNCMNAWPGGFRSLNRSESLLIVTHESRNEDFSRLGQTATLPSSVAHIRSAILEFLSAKAGDAKVAGRILPRPELAAV